jgi:uncharacterized protein (TIGR00730 family)
MNNKKNRREAERRPKKAAPQTKSSRRHYSEYAEPSVSLPGPFTPKSQRRKYLDERLRSLYQRVELLEKELKLLSDPRFYRVCIFGSARLKPESPVYQDVVQLARLLTWDGIDILTGGGPGLMEAANLGAKGAQKERNIKTRSIGLPIKLEWENEPNKHLDVKRSHEKFSSRLDDFMRLSHSIICTPGGIGTVLELFFSWQLIQVHHITPRPVVLMDRPFWTGIMDWMQHDVLDRGLVSAKDFDVVSIVDTPEEAAEIIVAHHKDYAASLKVK